VRDYFTLTTWASHCSWPMRKNHLLVRNSHLSLLALWRALVTCTLSKTRISFRQRFPSNLHTKKRTIQGHFFSVPLGVFLPTPNDLPRPKIKIGSHFVNLILFFNFKLIFIHRLHVCLYYSPIQISETWPTNQNTLATEKQYFTCKWNEFPAAVFEI
jgi:hypothetical protein